MRMDKPGCVFFVMYHFPCPQIVMSQAFGLRVLLSTRLPWFTVLLSSGVLSDPLILWMPQNNMPHESRGPYLGFRVTALTVHSPTVLALKGYWRSPRSTSHSAETETEAQKVAVFAQSPTAMKQCKASLSYLQGPFMASTLIKKGVTRAGGMRGG